MFSHKPFAWDFSRANASVVFEQVKNELTQGTGVVHTATEGDINTGNAVNTFQINGKQFVHKVQGYNHFFMPDKTKIASQMTTAINGQIFWKEHSILIFSETYPYNNVFMGGVIEDYLLYSGGSFDVFGKTGQKESFTNLAPFLTQDISLENGKLVVMDMMNYDSQTKLYSFGGIAGFKAILGMKALAFGASFYIAEKQYRKLTNTIAIEVV